MRQVSDVLRISSRGIRRRTTIDVRYFMARNFDWPDLWIPREFVQRDVDVELWNDSDVMIFWTEHFDYERRLTDDYELSQIIDQSEF